MDVSAVTAQVTLLPESSGEVLIDVVNTEDFIDALDVGLGGIPGASIRIDSPTPTLFPGERRRLTLRLQLPTQVPAGRHRAELEVRGVATGLRRSVDLDVDVPPRPALAAGSHPAVRRSWRRVDFPVTVTNRGNTPLNVLVRDLDVPDTVTIQLEPAQFDLAAWGSRVCQVRVNGPRRLVGGDIDHVVDLAVTARSTTPGRPLLESDLDQDTRVTFRQRPVLSPGVLLAVALVTVATLWLVGGFFGLRMFVRLVDPGAEPAPFFFSAPTAPARPDAAITVSGQMVSAVDGSPVAAVSVLACSRESADPGPASPTGPPPCTAKSSGAGTVSDGNGRFWLPGLFPGPYQLTFTGKGLTERSAPVQWFDASCSLSESVSAPRGALTVAVAYPAPTGAVDPVTVAVRPAETQPTNPAETSTSPSPRPSTSTTANPPIANTPAPPCSPAATGSASATNGPAGPEPTGGASPAATATAWPSRAAAGDGTDIGTATVVVKRLPAPARYDLTIDAGAGLTLTVYEVHLDAGQKHPVIAVTLPPSSSPTAGTP